MNYRQKEIEKRNKRTKLIKEILKKFFYIFLIVMLYNTFLITKSALDDNMSKEVFGYKAYIITTESMKPTMRVGDVVIVEGCNEENIKTGDIVVLKDEGEIITHRITQVIGAGEYATKGDNNNITDPKTIKFSQIEGKKVIMIPLLGRLLLLLKNITYIIILIVVIILIYLRVKKIRKRKDLRRIKKEYEDKNSEIRQDIENDS